MKQHQPNVLADTNLNFSVKLAIARDLERLYSPVLAEPIPAHLKSFVDRLGQSLKERQAR